MTDKSKLARLHDSLKPYPKAQQFVATMHLAYHQAPPPVAGSTVTSSEATAPKTDAQPPAAAPAAPTETTTVVSITDLLAAVLRLPALHRDLRKVLDRRLEDGSLDPKYLAFLGAYQFVEWTEACLQVLKDRSTEYDQLVAAAATPVVKVPDPPVVVPDAAATADTGAPTSVMDTLASMDHVPDEPSDDALPPAVPPAKPEPPKARPSVWKQLTTPARTK